ncbi:MAG: FlgK family flagellar hook-associated protein, partial [Acidimicrobiales bacterium]
MTDHRRAGTGPTATGSFRRHRVAVLTRHAHVLSGGAAAHDVTAATRAELHAAVGGPDGLTDWLGTLLQAFARLADAPTDRTARREVVAAATTLADRVNGLDRALERLQEEARRRVSDQAERLNTRLVAVAAVNRRIRTGTPGHRATDTAPLDVEGALSEIVELAGAVVTREPDGRHRIGVDGHVLVADATAWPVAVIVRASAPGGLGLGPRLVVRRAQGGAIRIGGGTIGGGLEVANRVVPEEHDHLLGPVTALTAQMNRIHRAGVGIDGVGGLDLFAPGDDPAELVVAPEILARPERLAAAAPGEGDHGAGNARRLAGLARPTDGPAADLAGAVEALAARRAASADRARADR